MAIRLTSLVGPLNKFLKIGAHPQLLALFVLALVLAVYLLTGCAPLSTEERPPTVTLQIQLDSAGILLAQAFPVKVLAASLHPVGEKQEQGWQQLPVTKHEIDLLSIRTDSATVAQGLLPPGTYNMAFIVLGDAHLEGQTRFERDVQTIVEPIGALVDLNAGQHLTIIVHLAALPFPHSPQKLALYAVDATISQGH
ncbi:MAG: DUF4382 domain-containing protein [Chloroflexi bacterium]|nr:DUF4382 domain-containing protein [Chloroflexota bacterium]